MPKEMLYTVADAEYLFALNRFNTVMREGSVNPVLMGGAGVQALVAHYVGRGGERSIEEMMASEDLREGTNLRRTNDGDFLTVTDYDNPTLLGIVGRLAGESIPTENGLYDISIERRATKRPVLYVTGLNGEARVMFNLLTGPGSQKRLDPKHYEAFFEQAIEVTLVNDDGTCTLYVERPEHLIANKLARGVPKDLFDTAVLVETMDETGNDLDRKEIRRVMGTKYATEYRRFATQMGWDE